MLELKNITKVAGRKRISTRTNRQLERGSLNVLRSARRCRARPR